MPTTAKGTPYVVSTDLVANYPTVSSDLADHIDDNLAYNAVSINAQTGTTYTFALADASEGKLVTASNAASSTYTVPPQSSVTWAAGAVIRILNQGAGVVTIAAGSGVTINGTPLTLAQYKGAALQRTASNTWTIIPFASGVGSAVITSPAKTGSYTSGGISYDYWEFSSTTSITVGTKGELQILAVAGGGGGGGSTSTSGGGGGGGGGFAKEQTITLDAGTYSCVVGAGGAGGGAGTTLNGTNGNGSGVKQTLFFAMGGGGGAAAVQDRQGNTGGTGGGSYGFLATGGVGNAAGGIGQQSYDGGKGSSDNASYTNGGGGGGAGAIGGNANGFTNAGAGGTGITSSYNNSATGYGGGGGGASDTSGGTGGTATEGGGAGSTGAGAGTAGTANRGGGGGGAARNNAGGNGGSGIVIIRVAV